MDRLSEIREAEIASHIKAYSSNELYEKGSWLAKPVKTVLNLLPLFDGHSGEFRALDLGCGVGRNSIAVAQAFSDKMCVVECVDLLDMAIDKLKKNAEKFKVSDSIRGIVSTIDDYAITPENYDLIMAVSALEHVDSEATFTKKLREICGGIRKDGIACLIVNTSVVERDKVTGEVLSPQFEVNLRMEELCELIQRIFEKWELIKHTIVHQRYDIPREMGMVDLETDVVTYVMRKR